MAGERAGAKKRQFRVGGWVRGRVVGGSREIAVFPRGILKATLPLVLLLTVLNGLKVIRITKTTGIASTETASGLKLSRITKLPSLMLDY